MDQLERRALAIRRRGPRKPGAESHLIHHRALRIFQEQRLAAVLEFALPDTGRLFAKRRLEPRQILRHDHEPTRGDPRAVGKGEPHAIIDFPPGQRHLRLPGVEKLDEFRRRGFVLRVVVDFIDDHGGGGARGGDGDGEEQKKCGTDKVKHGCEESAGWRAAQGPGARGVARERRGGAVVASAPWALHFGRKSKLHFRAAANSGWNTRPECPLRRPAAKLVSARLAAHAGIPERRGHRCPRRVAADRTRVECSTRKLHPERTRPRRGLDFSPKCRARLD